MSRSPLTDWLDDPRPARGVHVAEPDSGWRLCGYERLARRVWGAAAQLVELGLPPGGVVSVVLTEPEDFVAGFFAALAAGGTPSPISPPLVFRDAEAYVAHVAGVLRVATPAAVLADEHLLPIVTQAAERAAIAARPTVPTGESADAGAGRRPLAELALLQFTSGSTGSPRGVCVSRRNLEQNIAAIRAWLAYGPDHHVASWLPTYHDMGLIGCVLTPVTGQYDAWLMRPDQFVRSPVRWLECFGRFGAAMTATPNFGLSYTLSKVTDPGVLDGMDFSRWQAMVVGAERVDAATLGRFAELLRPFGFRPETLVPAYGLAEATLAVTGVAVDQVPTAVRLAATDLAMGARAPVTETRPVTGIAPGEGGWLTACGAPLDGVEIAVVDTDGAPLPDGALGEILVRGRSVAVGYRGGGDAFTASGLRTGDAGFVHDGSLFVIGRIGDAIKVRGRNLYAEDLEGRLEAIPGVPVGRCVVLLGSAVAGPACAVVAEAAGGEWVGEAASLLAREVGPGAAIRIFSVPRGGIQRTSSGKPRRPFMWRALAEGRPLGTLLWERA